MQTIVEGTYQSGKILLNEHPAVQGIRRVKVVFLDDKQPIEKSVEASSQMIRYGMFAGPIETNEKDFKMAEYREEDRRNGHSGD